MDQEAKQKLEIIIHQLQTIIDVLAVGLDVELMTDEELDG